MQFDSLTFLLFFLLVVGCYYLVNSWNGRKWLLLLASFVFYGAWNPPFLLLLIGSAILDWYLALRMAAAHEPKIRKSWLVISIVVNLSLLGFFKYGDFLSNNTVIFLHAIGYEWHAPQFDILLPVGISFYTFQSLSYCIDVYRRQVAVQKSLRDYVLFVAFFPQLVAGPIVRYSEFREQLEVPRRVTADGLFIGISLMIIGLFEKIVLADSIFAPVADEGFSTKAVLSSAQAWSATIAFSGQIFCDFAGYSTCAIGCAAVLGFHLPNNFRSPYAAIGFSDFWRRWHISLSSWLRDYLYVPLGGNRGSRWLTFRNLMLTMLLGGLWHGASWTFVVWGGFHGLWLGIERMLRGVGQHFTILKIWPLQFLYSLFTLLVVMWAWVWFRAGDFHTATRLQQSLLGLGTDGVATALTAEAKISLSVFAMIWILHWLRRTRELRADLARLPAIAAGLFWAVLLIAITLSPGTHRAFLYFQF